VDRKTWLEIYVDRKTWLEKPVFGEYMYMYMKYMKSG